MAEDYTPSPYELQDLIKERLDPDPYKPKTFFCAECGEKISKDEMSYRVEDERVHAKCYKPSNIIPLIPIGCENVSVWRKPSLS